jgi:hypothetical protein
LPFARLPRRLRVNLIIGNNIVGIGTADAYEYSELVKFAPL